MEINIDISKIDKGRIVERVWTNKEGKQITSKALKLKILKNKENKVIASGDGWEFCKTGFVKQLNANKDDNDKAPIIGDVLEFIKTQKKDTRVAEEDREITPDDIPF